MSADPKPDYLNSLQAAEACGIKVQTLRQQLSRGAFPEPDLILFRHTLWLRQTIDEYIAGKPGRIKRRGPHKTGGRAKIPRSQKIKQPSTTSPPRHANLSNIRAAPQDLPAISSVSEQVAKQIAATLRQAGEHCTTRDVMELAGADPDTLDYERQKLQQRVHAKLRGLKRQTL